jgi:hypothetical protein
MRLWMKNEAWPKGRLSDRYQTKEYGSLLGFGFKKTVSTRIKSWTEWKTSWNILIKIVASRRSMI